MKRLIFADLHLGLNKNNPIWLDLSSVFFGEIIDFCKNNNIKKIYCLGDFFHERKAVGTRAIDRAIDLANIIDKSGIDFYICPGNHDLYSNVSLKPSSLSVFDEYKNIHIAYDPIEIEDDLLVPWNIELTHLSSKFLFGHFPIKTFTMNNSFVCEDSAYLPEMFKNFEYVFSGHFHTRSHKKIENTEFVYVGSPFQHNFNDIYDRRGYYVMDGEDFEFIEFMDAPKHVKILSTMEPDQKEISGNIVKLVWNKDFGNIENMKLLEKIQNMNPLMLFPDYTCLENDDASDGSVLPESSKDLKIKTSKEILFDYIETKEIPSHLNKNVLLTMINKFFDQMEIL